MHPRFVDILSCPETGAPLTLHAEEHAANGTVRTGTLTGGGRSYPIIGGIPRFVDKEHYAASFGYEWRKWSRVQFEEENAGMPMAGHTKRMFETITGFTAEALRGKLVVEFGCGPGRFLDMVRKKGGIAVGIDLSLAVESARENFRDDPDVLIVQGDILNPPFRKGVFDAGYSIGVLHHTPDPARGFARLAGTVKAGGLVACCVYPKDAFYDYPSVALFRKFHNVTKGLFGNRLSLAYANFSAYVLYHPLALLRKIPLLGRGIAYLIERYLLVSLNLPDPRWRLLDIFDAITPSYASTHTADEVEGWFRAAGCREVHQTPWCPTSYTGVKGEGP